MCGVAPEGVPLLFHPGPSLSPPPVALAEEMTRDLSWVRWGERPELVVLLAATYRCALSRLYCPHPSLGALGHTGHFC